MVDFYPGFSGNPWDRGPPSPTGRLGGILTDKDSLNSVG